MKRILAVVAIIALALSTVGAASEQANAASEQANAKFKKSRMLDPEGKERKAELVFGGKTLTIHRKGHSNEVYSAIPVQRHYLVAVRTCKECSPKDGSLPLTNCAVFEGKEALANH